MKRSLIFFKALYLYDAISAEELQQYRDTLREVILLYVDLDQDFIAMTEIDEAINMFGKVRIKANNYLYDDGQAYWAKSTYPAVTFLLEDYGKTWALFPKWYPQPLMEVIKRTDGLQRHFERS